MLTADFSTYDDFPTQIYISIEKDLNYVMSECIIAIGVLRFKCWQKNSLKFLQSPRCWDKASSCIFPSLEAQATVNSAIS